MENERVRELVAIMFTDIIGYTALMQGDEEKAVNVRSRHRQIFQRQHELHQGRIVQYYGDGTLSVFKSAISAARCAMEIQLQLQQNDPVPLRIGLHIGDIVFDKTEVYGDGVNYASRIESMSVAGAILLSKSLNDELKNHRDISTISLGHFELKNIALPVEIFAITNQGIVVPDPFQLSGKHKPISNVLLTKLHISPPGDHTVHRAELFEKLSRGLTAKLTLISAPAGFGKTTLVSDWIVQERIPAAWYSLDNSDNDASEFLSYVITAIEGIIPGFGENVIKLIQSPNKTGLQSLIRLLINEVLAFGKHFILTLDDFHLITNREVLDLFSYFLEHLPDNIHLVLLTRVDPLLPLARLRSQRQLVELRSADLSFSADQIQFLFNRKLKLKLNQTDLQSLVFKTEGWIAGLQLIGLSLQGRQDVSAFIEDFKGDNRYIMDYLIEEVLRVQTDEIKEFLLQTSLLEQLSGPLCNAVLDRNDSQSVLETLENNNMFIVSLDSDRRWYRYHHLFADLLKQRLGLTEMATVTALHIKASNWFEKNQMYPLAIHHLLQTQNFEKAIKLLAVITEGLWENGHHSSIIKYGEVLPDEVIKQNPEFCLFYGWALITAGQIEKAHPFLVTAESIIRQSIGVGAECKSIYNIKLLGKIAVAMAYQHSFLGKPDTILEYCKIALENLSEQDPLWFSWGWYAVGTAELANENLLSSTEALRKALMFGKKSGNIYLITTIATMLAFNEGRLGLYTISYQRSIDLLELLKERGYGSLAKTDWKFAVLFANMAAIQYFWADLHEALDNITIAYNLCINEADMTSKVLVTIIYAVVLYGLGDLAGAKVKMKEIELILQTNKVNPFRESMFIGLKATVFVREKELENARSFLDSQDVRVGNTISYVDEYRYLALGLLMIAEHKLDDAFELLSQLYEMASAQRRIERMIEIKVFLSIVYIAQGEKEKAMTTLIESLEYAAPDEMLMYHLNYLDKINPILQEIFKKQAGGQIQLPPQFVSKLRYKIQIWQMPVKNQINLTKREIEALVLMAQNLSNQQIADKLFVSLNTVKTRLKNLYIKLDVESRANAVEKAKQMQLI